MYSTSVCSSKSTSELLRAKSNCTSKCSGTSPLYHSSSQQHDRPFSQLTCQAAVQQQAQVQQLVSMQARLHRGTAPARSCPCRAGMTLQRTGKQRSRAGALSATSAAGMTVDGGGAACTGMPSSPPMGPQRAATQRASGAGPGAPLQAAVATVAMPYVALQQEQQEQQQQHSVVHQEVVACQANVWLPDQQLWLPHPATCVASSSTPLSSRPGSSGSTLARVFMGSSATAGRKPRMEDRHVLAALHPEHGVADGQAAVAPQQAVSLAAVFDGHAGDATASFAARHIPQLLHSALSGQHCTADGPAVLTRELLTPRSALAASFQWFDRWWADARCDPNLTQHGWDDSGSTAVVSMVSGHQLVVANAGDSIALVAHNGTSHRLTEEHRLDNEAEAARVREAGGRVVRTHPGGAPRVMGTSTQTRYKGSMVTRSLGDFAFKSPQPLISAEPFVNTHNLEPTDKLVLLTSDGVTDVLADDDMLDVGLMAIEQARSRTNNGNALAKAAAKAVMEQALSKGSKDNITVVAMLLDWGNQYEDSPAQ